MAAGRFDGFWEYGLSSWDIAAGILLVREAGGAITDIDGGEDMLTKGTVLAATPALQLAFAGHRFSRGEALARALIYGESDDGALGACLVEAGEPIAQAHEGASR